MRRPLGIIDLYPAFSACETPDNSFLITSSEEVSRPFFVSSRLTLTSSREAIKPPYGGEKDFEKVVTLPKHQLPVSGLQTLLKC